MVEKNLLNNIHHLAEEGSMKSMRILSYLCIYFVAMAYASPAFGGVETGMVEVGEKTYGFAYAWDPRDESSRSNLLILSPAYVGKIEVTVKGDQFHFSIRKGAQDVAINGDDVLFLREDGMLEVVGLDWSKLQKDTGFEINALVEHVVSNLQQ